MEERHLTSLMRTRGALTGRRSVLSALIGTSAGWALAGEGAVEAHQERPSPVLGDAPAPLPVNLVGKIAGEDLANDWIRVVSEPGMLTTHTHGGAPIAAGETRSSTPIDSSRFRSYAAMAYGAEGPITLRLEISPDGETWFWHPNGESPALQHPVQTGALVTPLCRLSVVNGHTAEQDVQSWVVLAR